MFIRELGVMFEADEAASPLLSNFDPEIPSIKSQGKTNDSKKATRHYCVSSYDPTKSNAPIKVNIIVARQVRNETGVPKRVVVETATSIRRTVAWGRSSADPSSLACSSRSVSNENDPFINIASSSTNDFGMEWGFESPAHYLEQSNDSGSMSCSLSSVSGRSAEEDTIHDQHQKPLNIDPNFSLEIKKYSVPIVLKDKRKSEPSSPVVPDVGDVPTESTIPRITKFACPVEHCSIVLLSRTALRKHAKVHAARVFSCEKCGKSFAENTKLKRHLKVHGEKREYKCSVASCGKTFLHNFSLTAHMKTHTGEKPHVCSICNFAFLHPYNLKVHIERKHKI